jgi:ferredoxin
MKPHDLTGVTLSVKNVLGMIPKSDRKTAHRIGIDKAIVSVFAYLVRYKKVISLVDGIYAMEGKGSPTHGKPVEMDLIVAGDDAVATDVTCAEIMGLKARKVKHLLLSEKLGLGKMNGREIIGEKVENVRRRFEIPPAIPSSRSFLLSYIMKKFFKKTPFLKHEERCTGCKLCIENCPIGNVTMEGKEIRINKKCIGCMVCVESCKEGALDYEISHEKVYKTASAIKHVLRTLKPRKSENADSTMQVTS